MDTPKQDDFNFDNLSFDTQQAAASEDNILLKFHEGVERLKSYEKTLSEYAKQYADVQKEFKAAIEKLHGHDDETVRREAVLKESFGKMEQIVKSVPDELTTKGARFLVALDQQTDEITASLQTVNEKLEVLPKAIAENITKVEFPIKSSDIERVDDLTHRVESMAARADGFFKSILLSVAAPAFLIILFVSATLYLLQNINADKERLLTNSAQYYQEKGQVIVSEEEYTKLLHEITIFSQFMNRADTKNTTQKYLKFRESTIKSWQYPIPPQSNFFTESQLRARTEETP